MFRIARIKKANVNYKDAVLEWMWAERSLAQDQDGSEVFNKLLSNIKKRNGG